MNSPSFLLTLMGETCGGHLAASPPPPPGFSPKPGVSNPPLLAAMTPRSPFVTPDPRSAWSRGSFYNVDHDSRTSGPKAAPPRPWLGALGIRPQQVPLPSSRPGRVGGLGKRVSKGNAVSSGPWGPGWGPQPRPAVGWEGG